MSATRISSRSSEDRLTRRVAELRSYSSRARCDQRQGRRDRQADAAGELSQNPRMRALANFLGYDAQSVAEGIIEAARRDPGLRLQRI